MEQSRPQHRPPRQGGNTIILIIILTAVAGGFAAYMIETNNHSVRQSQAQQTYEASRMVNSDNLAMIGSLVQFPRGVPANAQIASNNTYVPAVYPDPYINVSNKTVRLIAVTTPPSTARWSSDGAGTITLKGFNPSRLPDSAMNSLFQNGTELSTTSATYGGNSKVNLVGESKNPANPLLIDKITVASGASLTGSAVTSKNSLQALVPIPVPPPPIAVATYSASASPLTWGQTASVSLHVYGITSQVAVYLHNSATSVCTPTLPPEAGSILNTLTNGFDLGTCAVPMLQVYDQEASPPNPTWGYMTVDVRATGPGGITQTTTPVAVIKPPTCTFQNPLYQATEAQPTPISIVTSGIVTGSGIELPTDVTVMGENADKTKGIVVSTTGWYESGAWNSGTTANFNPGDNYGVVTDVPGRVTGPGVAPGTWIPCGNTTNININQAVCYEHGTNTYSYLGACYYVTENGADEWTKWTSYSGDYNLCDGFWYSNSSCSGAPISDRDEGCFTPETTLLLADGSSRRIDKLRPKELLRNPLTGEIQSIKRMVKGPEKEAMLELGYDHHVVHVTTKHPFLTRNGMHTAVSLAVGDEVLGADRHYHRLEIVQRLPVRPDQQVYNVELTVAEGEDQTAPAHHGLVADGILTGDLYLQEKLAKETLLARAQATSSATPFGGTKP